MARGLPAIPMLRQDVKRVWQGPAVRNSKAPGVLQIHPHFFLSPLGCEAADDEQMP